MRKAVLLVLAACALLTAVSTASAKARRNYVHRSAPEILVVPKPYGAPRVYVRRYEALVYQYVGVRRYHARRYAACGYPRRTVRVCGGHRRYYNSTTAFLADFFGRL